MDHKSGSEINKSRAYSIEQACCWTADDSLDAGGGHDWIPSNSVKIFWLRLLTQLSNQPFRGWAVLCRRCAEPRACSPSQPSHARPSGQRTGSRASGRKQLEEALMKQKQATLMMIGNRI